MHVSGLTRLLRAVAAPVLALRAGIVGVNFLVMLVLAWRLGLAGFGELMVLWGIALVLGTVLSCGAPLVLLRALGNGAGLRLSGFVRQCVIYPLVLAVIAALILPAVFSHMAWPAVIAVALAHNALSCLASIMRGLGSIQISMALRDGMPQLALLGGLASFGRDPVDVLAWSAVIMGLAAVAALMWCVSQARQSGLLRPDGGRGELQPALWGNAVVGMLAAQADIIVGGQFLSAAETGLYSLVRRIVNVMVLPVSVASWVSAGPIAAAHGQNDRRGLSAASRKGSRIALWPGCVIGVCILAAFGLWQVPEGAFALSLILLAGGFVQVFFASGMTVATLCGFARQALWARVWGVGLYLVAAMVFGLGQTPVGNGLAYLAGLSGTAVALWWIMMQRLDVDTSAMALWPRWGGRVRWKML